jgi:hypothetical protein
MSGIARATLSSGKKSSSVLQLARTRGAGPQTDPGGREGRNDRNLLERLEAENRELRNQAIQLALQVQVLRHGGRSEERPAGHRPSQHAFASVSREARATASRRRPNRLP